MVACHSTAAPLQLPASWPLAPLTLPPDATPATLYPFGPGKDLQADTQENAVHVDPDSGPPVYWIVAFHTSRGWDQLVADARAALEPLGYRLIQSDAQGGPHDFGDVAELYAEFDCPTRRVFLHCERIPATALSQRLSRVTIKILTGTAADFMTPPTS